MPPLHNDKTDVLIKEVRELKNEIKELRMLLLYELLKTEDQRFRSSETLLAVAKQALKAAVEQLADFERKTDLPAREAQRSSKERATSRKDVPKPTIDVEKEIAILKKEMASSLRNAAKEIEEGEEEEKEDTE